jgi:hypothetical protein
LAHLPNALISRKYALIFK